jgi:predicted Zn-dependent protease
MKTLLSAALITLIAFSFISEARAERRYHTQLDYILIENPYLATKVAMRAVRGAIADINADKVIRLGIGRRKVDGDPFKDRRNLTSKNGGLYQFQTYFTSYSSHYKSRVNPKRLTIIVDPPIAVDGVNYMGGFAWLGGAFTKPISYCNGMEYNDKGLPRFRHLEQCIRHEVYHLLCVTHDDSRGNVMHPSALAEYEIQRVAGDGARLPLLDRSKREIRECIKTEARRYRR